VGETVGVSVVGFLEGEVLGWYVGSAEGEMVGETVGVSVVGFFEGEVLGFFEGEVLG